MDGLEDDDDETSDVRRRRPAAAFDLAACPRAFGTVALVYASRLRRDHKNDHTRAPRCSHDTEVWFQDPAARWWFLAKSFSAYFRLAHANLGLPNWQARATDVGMDPDSNAWFRWMAPQTLALDVERGVVRRMKKKRDANKRDRERASPPRFATEQAKDAKPSARASRRLGAAAAAAVGADRGGRAREKPRRTDSRGFRS